jgi:glyoxylase I family protein
MGKPNRIRLEHIALNVEDPAAMACWYSENLRMKIIRKGPPPVNGRFVSDEQENMMLEFYMNSAEAIPDYRAMNPSVFHICFMVDDVEGICRQLVAAGAMLVTETATTEDGDEIAMLRDPWGVPIQFLKRAEPMVSFGS